MNLKILLIASSTLLVASLAGCVQDSGPVHPNSMNIIAGGVGQDIPARIFQEYGMDTTCDPANSKGHSADGVLPCPDDNGYPHLGGVCSNMKWSVQFRNDHPYANSEEKYGLPYDSKLINSLQEWRATQQELRFYWVRYSDTQCKYTDNDVIYCVELTSLSLTESQGYGCINAMHRTFPGLDTSWKQSLDYANPSKVADATSSAS